jgi:peptidoglycan-associated lipoprotein
MWEDTKTGGRYMGTGLRKMGGKHHDSRQIRNRDEFGNVYDVSETPVNDYSYRESEFVPLQDEYGNDLISMQDVQPPRELPGDPGSSLPGIEAFVDPSTNPQLSPVFQNVYFEYNSSLIKGQSNLETLKNISDYMKAHDGTYIFVEGHTDERGPEAYNLALGSRRANSIRNYLIQEGVDPDNVFTISYGKERPLVMESHDEAWSKNRRGEFKVYAR